MKLNIKEREVDLDKAFPLQVKDMRKFGTMGLLSADGNVDLSDMNKLLDVALYIAQKADPELKTEEFDELPVEKLNEMMTWVGEQFKENPI